MVSIVTQESRFLEGSRRSLVNGLGEMLVLSSPDIYRIRVTKHKYTCPRHKIRASTPADREGGTHDCHLPHTGGSAFPSAVMSQVALELLDPLSTR